MIDNWDEFLRNKANDDAYKVNDDNDAYNMFLPLMCLEQNSTSLCGLELWYRRPFCVACVADQNDVEQRFGRPSGVERPSILGCKLHQPAKDQEKYNKM